jgi:hypothetical protein
MRDRIVFHRALTNRRQIACKGSNTIFEIEASQSRLNHKRVIVLLRAKDANVERMQYALSEKGSRRAGYSDLMLTPGIHLYSATRENQEEVYATFSLCRLYYA